MYMRPENGQPPRRVILSHEEKEAVLTDVHAGHFGSKRMIGKINQRFFWHGIVKDVDEWASKTIFLFLSFKNSSKIVIYKHITFIHSFKLIFHFTVGF